ncbi:HEAT repeat domain-containing protein [Actinoplanes solisilvae]|uniref:HEAT repeat domain-containing protein n=1 Tax=Actinoplanes solisilvae TaxID=2486853 RepID=UPI0013E3F0ED|nr:HEAT repeat domain-containing protein [Actinoplanes solisilvae]
MLYSVAADESMGRMGYGQLVDRLAGFQRHTWFVEGAAGSGKSTLIKELALSLLDRGAPCVLVDNRSLRFHSIQEIDAREFAKRCRPAEVDQPLWKSRTKHGQIVFLVDAVNEIEREFSGTTKWDFVRSLIEGGHKYPVVATSRSWLEGLGYSYLRNVDRLSLLPLTEGEVQHYLDMRGAASGDAMVELHATGMSGAASNPFLLSLLADWLLDGHRDAGRPAPRSRAALLHATVARPKDEGRYSAADKQLELSGLTMDATLCGAALVAFLSSQGDMNFTATDLTALLRRVWPDGDLASSATQLFNDTQMVHRSGVPDGGDDSYALSHPALVDFGLAIGWQRGSLPSIAWDPGFLDQCMADWVGLQHDPDSTVRTLLGLGKAAPRYDLLVDVLVANRGLLSSETQAQMWQHLGMGFLSGRNARNGLVTALQRIPFWLVREGVQRGLLRRLRRASPELADEVLLAFQDRTLNPDSFQQLRRRRGRREVDANKVLTVQNVDAALVEQRIMSLRSAGAAKVRMNAASWLAANAPQAAVLAVTAALREDPDDRVRGSAATALGRIGSSDAVLTLTAVLRDDGGSNVRGSAATALGRIGSAEAVPALTAALGGDADNSVRGAAATALGRIGSPDAVSALTAVLRDDGGSNVRGSAATALGSIGSAEAVPALTAALGGDADNSVRGAAATALGRIGSPDAVSALTAVLRDDGGSNVRGSAATALGSIGSAEAVPALTAALGGDADNSVRGAAATALGRIGSPDAVSALTAVLRDDGGSNVRGSAATALGRIGSADAVPALTVVLGEDADDSVRGSAATALGSIGSADAVPALTAALREDADNSVRGSAATALGSIGSADAVPALTAALREDADNSVRGAAATALGRIGSPDAVSALTAVLRDDGGSNVRGSAATALGRIGSADAVPALTVALREDAEYSVRGSAATALGSIGSAVAVPALTAALREDAENSVRGSAASALGRIGRPEVLPDLQRSITSETEDYWVRASAVLALGGLEVPIDSWLIGLADNLRYTASAAHREAAKRLRGTIVNLISRRSVTAEANLWLRDVARSDSDPINRTAAIEGLSRARALDPDIVRFTIAPTSARADGRSRDTDDGVCGAAAAAVIRMAQYDEEVALSLLPSVVALITSSETWSSVVNAALAPIVNLPLETAERVLIRIKELAQSRAGTNTWFLNAVERNAVVLDQRKQSRADLRLLAQAPERMLSEFRDQRKSRFELTDVLPQRCEVALLTAIPVETRAVREVLGDLQLVPQPIQRRGRYFDMVTLPTGPDTATNVVITQATDKGGQSASAVTHDIIAEFQPQLIILVGVCGGFPEHGVSLYDVIVARNVFNYDPERLQADRGGDRPQFYRTDEQLLRLASYLHGRGDLDDAMDSSKLHVKDYASGEKVIAWKDADLRARLLQMSTDLYGIETEGHGLMHAVWETFKADQFVGGSIIKCVSDLGDEEMGVDKTAKQAAAARKAARLALDLARAFRRT